MNFSPPRPVSTSLILQPIHLSLNRNIVLKFRVVPSVVVPLLLFLFASIHSATAQISKGQQILITRGLQIQGLSQDDCYLHLDTYSNANYTSIL